MPRHSHHTFIADTSTLIVAALVHAMPTARSATPAAVSRSAEAEHLFPVLPRAVESQRQIDGLALEAGAPTTIGQAEA